MDKCDVISRASHKVFSVRGGDPKNKMDFRHYCPLGVDFVPSQLKVLASGFTEKALAYYETLKIKDESILLSFTRLSLT